MAPKPRGLKASRKAPAAYVPPAASSSENAERTFPLDEDALTILDLFELRTSSINLLLTRTETSAEEAQALLRGILHGADGLLRLVPSTFSSQGTLPSAENRSPSVRAPSEELLKALGMFEPLAPAHLAYLQAFALHELSTLSTAKPTSQLARSSALEDGAPTKKRKIDVNEPTSPSAWLDQALPRYEEAVAYKPQGEDDVPALWRALVKGDQARALCARAGLVLDAKDEKLAKDLLEQAKAALGAASEALTEKVEAEDAETFAFEFGSPQSAVRGGVAAYVRLVEGAYELGTPSERVALLQLAEAWTQGEGWALASDEKEVLAAFEVELAVLKADLALAVFVLLEEEVEDKYRPDADEEADDEAEVEALPDNEEVATAKAKGELALAALRQTLKLVAALPKDKQDPALLYAQHKKLEEALLMSSALINPEDEDALDKIEKEVAEVRKEGGIEVEEEDEEDEE